MQIHNHLARKLCRLLSFLENAYNEFDNISKQIEEKRIKMSVRSVATRTKQYVKELNSQLHMLNVKHVLTAVNETEDIKGKPANKELSDKKILEHCCSSEVFFSTAYNSVLNEHLSFKPLRDMLKYQLTGIHHAFRQLKLLNAVITMKTSDVMVH